MSKKGKAEIAGVIEISSNEMRLKIAQNSKGKYKLLDTLTYPLSLGRDTFYNGRIGFEKADKACGIIKNYLSVLKEYGVDITRAVATTAVREAENKELILDQIKIKTGLDVDVLDDEEEKRYIKRMMFSSVDKEHLKSALMVYMGSGNIGIAAVNDGCVTFMQNIKIGALRISELFEKVYEHSSEFYLVVEEYLRSITKIFKEMAEAKYLLAAGMDIQLIAKLLGAKRANDLLYMPKDDFKRLYDEIKHKTFSSMAEEYKITIERAELFFTLMCIYNNLLDFVSGDVIATQSVSLCDAILFEMLYPEEAEQYIADFNKNTVHHAKVTAKRFGADEEHFNKTEKFTLKIYDKIRKLHGLGAKERLYLQIACILHDIGKAINIKSHSTHSHTMIKSLDISGLTSAEKETIALIAYYHGNMRPSGDTEVTVLKLAAILRLGDVLAKSEVKKYDDIDVKIDEEKMIITVYTDHNIDLEKWAFNDKCGFFEEVFGIKAVLKKKKVTK